jgi:hypothetical protein
MKGDGMQIPVLEELWPNEEMRRVVREMVEMQGVSGLYLVIEFGEESDGLKLRPDDGEHEEWRLN